jgi:hypothetical protein
VLTRQKGRRVGLAPVVAEEIAQSFQKGALAVGPGAVEQKHHLFARAAGERVAHGALHIGHKRLLVSQHALQKGDPRGAPCLWMVLGINQPR